MNTLYLKLITEDYYRIDMTFADFMRVCEILKLPTFEVKVTINPFAASKEERSIYSYKIYEDIMTYRKTMPEWSAREYDYQYNKPTCFYTIPEIKKGDFVINVNNKSASYNWHFQVLEGCVVVHSVLQITD